LSEGFGETEVAEFDCVGCVEEDFDLLRIRKDFVQPGKVAHHYRALNLDVISGPCVPFHQHRHHSRFHYCHFEHVHSDGDNAAMLAISEKSSPIWYPPESVDYAFELDV
jgi:hypothetical protein